jgi:REP element-mobilizing transposase RayT
MPVYLFTFHAYRSWMPSHRRGYTKRGKGYFPTDENMAQNYESRANHDPTIFDEELSRILIEQLRESCVIIHCRLHAGTTEPTHIHGLVSWKHVRGWMSIRSSLKTALTKRLKAIREDLALSRGASRKQVKDRSHFDYLLKTYLPAHHGLAWYEDDRGWKKQQGTRRKKKR